MSNTAIRTLFNGNGATVRAWLLSGLAWHGTDMVSGNLRDINTSFHLENGPCNHINGYNLTLDNAKFTGTWYLTNRSPSDGGLDTQALSSGAIPLKFVTPLPDNKYKVFVQMKTVGGWGQGNNSPAFTHCLNSAAFPKTNEGFWVRFGLLLDQGTATAYANANMNGRGATPFVSPPVGKIKNQALAAFAYQLQVMVI